MRTMRDYAAAIRDIAMPERIRRLPISPRGFPTPWFVAWIQDGEECRRGEGEPNFLVIGSGKVAEAWNNKRCWICGDPLGANLAMVLGPMCVVNRTVSEPASHRECAIYACRACPFLANPRARRNEKGLPEEHYEVEGGIRRNPGVIAVWMTRHVRPFRVANGYLFSVGDPTEVMWFCEGREATRGEVDRSIASGLPLLEAEAAKQGASSMRALEQCIVRAIPYLPAALVDA